MKKLAIVSVISLFLVFAYAFTPSTNVTTNPNLYSVLDDTTKSVKKKSKKDCNTKTKSDCSSKFTKKKCCSSKDKTKKKKDKN